MVQILCSDPLCSDLKSQVPSERVHLLYRAHLCVTWLLSCWAAWTSPDQTHTPAESHPWPDTGRRPGCVCTVRKERRRQFITWMQAAMWLMTRIRHFGNLTSKISCKHQTREELPGSDLLGIFHQVIFSPRITVTKQTPEQFPISPKTYKTFL